MNSPSMRMGLPGLWERPNLHTNVLIVPLRPIGKCRVFMGRPDCSMRGITGRSRVVYSMITGFGGVFVRGLAVAGAGVGH